MRRQQVGLVEDHQIGGAELVLEQLLERAVVIERRVGGALRLERRRFAREQAVAHGRRIDHRDHAVDRDAGADLRPLKRLHQRLRQGEAGGLDHDVIGRRHALQQALHGRHEIIGDRAADAAIRQLDDVVLGAGGIAAAEQQLAIDADLAELVDDQRDAAAAGMAQQVLDQAGLAGAEEAR